MEHIVVRCIVVPIVRDRFPIFQFFSAVDTVFDFEVSESGLVVFVEIEVHLSKHGEVSHDVYAI